MGGKQDLIAFRSKGGRGSNLGYLLQLLLLPLLIIHLLHLFFPQIYHTPCIYTLILHTYFVLLPIFLQRHALYPLLLLLVTRKLVPLGAGG